MRRDNPLQIIHAAKCLIPKKGWQTLLLKKVSPERYLWFQEEEGKEKETQVEAFSIEEAIRLAHIHWKHHSFRTLICGFLYTLPERDEHGINALFYQMAASYRSPNGIYFEEALGHMCHVQNASREALDLWKRIKS